MHRSRWLLFSIALAGCGTTSAAPDVAQDASSETSSDDASRDEASIDARSLDASDARREQDSEVSVEDARSMDSPGRDAALDAADAMSPMDVRSDVRSDAAATDVRTMTDVASDRPASDGAAPADSGTTSPVVLPAHHASLRTAQVWAEVSSGPPSITVRWASVTGRAVTAIAVDRKPLNATTWTPVATPSATANAWTDTTVVVGETYEYQVRLTVGGVTRYGYVASGIRVETDNYRGRIALVIDDTLRPMIVAELAELEADLYGDGWIPVIVPVSRAATSASVRAQLVALRAMHADLSAAYLIGHVPVAYAGANNPDGHGGGRVMAADGYYAELSSTWRGATGCANAPEQATLNDAPSATNMFCEPDFPSTVELAVGRVDTSSLPQYPMSEAALLRGYLNKAHRFKTRQWAAQTRAFIKDGLGEAGLNTGLGAWATYGALVGPTNIAVDNASTTFLYQLLDGASHLFAFGSYYGASCGGSVNGVVGSTATVFNRAWGAVFNHTIGSYFGEHNCRDGFLRGLLLSGNALAHSYNALHWWFHPMGMGQPLASTVTRTMNNKLLRLYSPLDSSIASTSNTHLAMMGDPTLRALYIAPPTALSLVNTGGRVEARWSASAEAGIDGYHVYQATAAGFTRLTAAPIAATRLTTAVAFAPGVRIVVRAIKLHTTASGSYFASSVGAVAVSL